MCPQLADETAAERKTLLYYSISRKQLGQTKIVPLVALLRALKYIYSLYMTKSVFVNSNHCCIYFPFQSKSFHFFGCRWRTKDFFSFDNFSKENIISLPLYAYIYFFSKYDVLRSFFYIECVCVPLIYPPLSYS